jgi:hypothetical protein
MASMKRLENTRARRTVVVTFCLILASIIGWRLYFRSPDFQLRFLHTTNSQYGVRGVFEMSNYLAEPAVCGGGFLKKAAEKSIDIMRGDFGTDAHFKISPKSSTTFKTWIPTNGGPYRLVMPGIPARKLDPQYYKTFGARVAQCITRLIHLTGPNPTTSWRLTGWSFAQTEPFHIAKPENGSAQ